MKALKDYPLDIQLLSYLAVIPKGVEWKAFGHDSFDLPNGLVVTNQEVALALRQLERQGLSTKQTKPNFFDHLNPATGQVQKTVTRYLITEAGQKLIKELGLKAFD